MKRSFLIPLGIATTLVCIAPLLSCHWALADETDPNNVKEPPGHDTTLLQGSSHPVKTLSAYPDVPLRGKGARFSLKVIPSPTPRPSTNQGMSEKKPYKKAESPKLQPTQNP